MRAMVYHKYGTKDVLKLTELDVPKPKDNEILVNVKAVSVNSWDWDLLRGKPFLSRIGGLIKPKYKILGADIAGRVEVVGKDIKQFQPGDEVFGDISWCGWGGYAEYISVREEALTLSQLLCLTRKQQQYLKLLSLRYRHSVIKGKLRKDKWF
ncbi:alcohol dehydrogenase catalytic domain-containing protein [Neobacillus sp. FSL H8-0543]|uniref:alcohol dehydrogenase catalytic domain-containing protein n=1 Tax=Neobacillus sp. FSL H8-0543 TaxID=2954672 RepID=UPI0031589BEC